MLRLLKGSKFEPRSGRILSSIKYRCKYSHHIKDKGNDGANDNERIHQVPDITQIRSGMRDNAQIDDLYK